MELYIENKGFSGFTAVPNAFLDIYMPEAGGEFIKVYLYLIRAAQQSSSGIDISDLADRLHYTEKDVLRALRYWEKQGILALSESGGEILSVSILPVVAPGEESVRLKEADVISMPGRKPAASAEALQGPETDADLKLAAGGVSSDDSLTGQPEKTAEPGVVPVPAKQAPQGVRAVSVDELADLQEDRDFAEVVYVAEMYLKRTLSSKDVQLFAYLYKDLAFPAELIEYLVEYCVNGGHASYKYMESVAIGWHEEGIRSADEAREAHQEYSTENRRVMQAFGISGRTLAMREKQFVKRWRKDLGMPLDVITEAINATMTATHQPSFEYTDRILSDWYDKGVKSVAQAKEAQTARKIIRKRQTAPEKPENRSRLVNFDQRQADLAALLKDGNW